MLVAVMEIEYEQQETDEAPTKSGGGRCKTETSWTATIKQYSEEFLVQ